MDKEIKYLLEEIKDNTYDYVGTNGCLYQDLSREELNLLLEYISNLQNQVQKQKEVIGKAIEYINKYESIKAYYEYIDEDGYDEYNYDEDFKKELLDILKESGE